MIKTIHIKKISCFILSIFFIIGTQKTIAGSFSYGHNKAVVGSVQHHIVAPKETLLDIVRNFGLGYNELSLLYPKMDPWIPSPGRNLVIPTQWVLPSTKLFGLVINLPELRLYHFIPKTGMVATPNSSAGKRAVQAASPKALILMLPRKLLSMCWLAE